MSAAKKAVWLASKVAEETEPDPVALARRCTVAQLGDRDRRSRFADVSRPRGRTAMSYLTHPRRRHHPCRRTHRMGNSNCINMGPTPARDSPYGLRVVGPAAEHGVHGRAAGRAGSASRSTISAPLSVTVLANAR
jgi:hypothetical protein